MDAVKAYRKRRKERLLKRFDEEDIEWITTKNGAHVPLKDGKAVGGPLKGEDFSKAESGKTVVGKKLGEKRGQIDTGKGAVSKRELESFNHDALGSIMRETGYGYDEAKQLQDALVEYMGGDFTQFRQGNREEMEKKIDEGLARMGAYDGVIYRGMRFNAYNQEENDKFDYFDGLEIGDEIQMESVSSWTSNEIVANSFGECANEDAQSVIITCKNNKSGVGVQHISKFRNEESEVLAPSEAKWRVTAKRKESKLKFANELLDKYYDISEKGDAGISYLGDEIRNLHELLYLDSYIVSIRDVLCIEVEEI